MRVLIVEDNPHRHEVFNSVYSGDEIVHAYSYSEAVAALAGNKFDLISLDHDLAEFQPGEFVPGMYGKGRELTGYDVALFITQMPEDKWPDKVVIHSVNPSGSQMILSLMERNGIPSIRQPFIIQD